MKSDIKPSDFGIDHFLEPEEIDQLTVAEYRVYERKLRNYRDWKNTIDTAKKIALEEGWKEGLEEEREKQRIEGEKKKAIEVARKMKSKHYPINEIIELTNLTEEEINAL